MQRLILVAALAAAATPALSQAPTQRLTADSAQAIIAGCAAHAAAKDQSHAIAVFDSGVNLVAFLKMERNNVGVAKFAMEKGKASATWGGPTSRALEVIKDVPGFAYAPDVALVPGGVPIFSADGKIHLGGVGVSGEAPEDDVGCAEAGIEAAGLKYNRAAN